MFRFLIVSVLALSLVTGLSACSDTWQGIKKDTGDNMKTTGKAIEKTGEKVKD
jgi:predicted small secreted protein